MGDVIVIALVILAMGLASAKLISDRKKGIGSCGHRCSECSGSCASRVEPSEEFKQFIARKK